MDRVRVAAVLAVVFAAGVTFVGVRSGGFAAPVSNLDMSKAQETIKYYDVHGTTIDELRQEVYSQGPYDRTGKRFAGWAEWRIQWFFSHRQVPQGCAVGKAVTETHIQYTLPRWVDEDAASPELRETWRRFVEALAEHEQGHGQLARELAAAIEDAIGSLPPEATCDDLGRKVDALAKRMIREDKSQESYDLATGHGRTQGAAFPTIVVRAGAEVAEQQ